MHVAGEHDDRRRAVRREARQQTLDGIVVGEPRLEVDTHLAAERVDRLPVARRRVAVEREGVDEVDGPGTERLDDVVADRRAEHRGGGDDDEQFEVWRQRPGGELLLQGVGREQPGGRWRSESWRWLRVSRTTTRCASKSIE